MDKFQNLEKCMQNDQNKKNYSTVQSSIDYEKENNIYMINHNATLSLLRLIRGLDFIRKFLENLHKNRDNNKKTPELATIAYEQTLSFRHKWVVRKAVKTGLYLLPYKQDLLVIMTNGIESHMQENKSEAVFLEFLATIDKIYLIIHQVFEKNNFLELVLA